MLNNPLILVGTDLSPSSFRAIRTAEALRRRSGGRLHLVHITPPVMGDNWLQNDALIQQLPANLEDTLIKDLSKRLEKQLLACEAQGTFEVLRGKAADTLLELAESRSANLLIVGHRGAEERPMFLGSVSAKLIAMSHVPVMVVNRDGEPRKVAGLVDTAEPISSILDATAEFSRYFSAKTQFLSLWPDISVQMVRRSPLMSAHPTYGGDERQKILESMRKTIQEKAEAYPDAEIKVGISEKKQMAQALTDSLFEDGVDLAVMCRHNRSFLEKFLVGSVTRRMLDLYKGNLLILPPVEN